MRPDVFGLDRLMCGRVLGAGIFALMLTCQTYNAHAAPSVRVLATLPQAGGAITHHMSGGALPVGAKYRRADSQFTIVGSIPPRENRRYRLLTASPRLTVACFLRAKMIDEQLFDQRLE
jgi:hypothetical protein